MESEGYCYDEELIADPSDFREKVETAILSKQLNEALKTLKTDELALIDLFYGAGKSQSEIAELLGVSQQAISKKLNRVLMKIKKCID